MSPLVSFSRGEHVQEVDSGRDIFPKRLIDKPFSRAMVNQRAFGKTRGKLFILEKRSRWFIKSDSPKITNGIRRTSVYLSIIAFDPRWREGNGGECWHHSSVLYFLIRTNSDRPSRDFLIEYILRLAAFFSSPSSSTTFFHFILAFH